MTHKIRLLEVTATLKPAGAEHLVVGLASTLDPDRYEVEVVSLFAAFPGGLEEALQQKHIPVRHLGKHSGLDLRMFPRISRVIDMFRPDIIHTHCYVTRYTFPFRVPVRVHTVHNLAPLETDFVGRLLNRYAFQHGVFPVAVGTAVAESLRNVYGLAGALAIPNGIDTQQFWKPETRNSWRERNGFRDQDLIVVSVGRLSPQKNPTALVRAMKSVPEAALLLVGQGELRRELEGYPRVHLLGVREDIPEILAAADIFALASGWEGLPLAVIEAMAAGLPVVATSVGCIPEVVQHGKTGLLVKRNCESELIAALRTLAQSPAIRRSMGDAARRRAQDFSLQAMVSAYEGLFEKLLLASGAMCT